MIAPDHVRNFPGTLDYHYGKHHASEADKLNRLVAGTEVADTPQACDVWEPACYNDYCNSRLDHLQTFWRRVKFMNRRFIAAGDGQPTGRAVNALRIPGCVPEQPATSKQPGPACPCCKPSPRAG
jgi:hypothetical protein